MIPALVLSAALALSPEEATHVQIKGNQSGMIALGVWALASTVTGAVGVATTHDPQWQGAHAANIVWGAINLVIAVIGIAQNARATERPDEKVYVWNAALDVVYLGASAAVWQNVRDPRVAGFAQASFVQALWLLMFDSTMTVFHQILGESR